MKDQIKKNKEAMGSLLADMRGLIDLADEEKRDMTPEEEQRYSKMEKDYDALETKTERMERSLKREERAQESSNEGHQEDPEERAGGDQDEERRDAVFERFLRNGIQGLAAEERDMLAGDDVSGGYLVTPQKFVNSILKAADDMVVIREMATIQTLTQASSLGVVKLDDDIDDWEWTTELKTGSDDSGLGFGKRELAPHPMAKRVKMSETLIRLSGRDVQGLVRSRMAHKLGVTMEKNYMTGNGVKKPLGLFVASSDGISTSRDVSTDMSATSPTADGLISVQGALKDAYQGKAEWLFHRDAITKIRKLKDTNGQYIWQPGLSQGTGNQILGKPYKTSEYAPNTFTTGQYVGMYGDFAYYWILDVMTMAIKVLKELYAEENKIGYIGRYEGDGQPVLEEAFCRVKLA